MTRPELPPQTAAWLLEAPEPYIHYQAALLVEPGAADPALLDGDAFVQGVLASLSGWAAEVVTRHDKVDLFLHRLSMLADLGVTVETRGAREVVTSFLDAFDEDGTFKVPIMIPTAFGGTGEVGRDWVICDFPVTIYSLLKMGVQDPRLERAVEKLVSLAGPEHYTCCGSIPRFKGPGPRGGLCPYANLLVARALGAVPAVREVAAAAATDAVRKGPVVRVDVHKRASSTTTTMDTR